MRWAFWHRLSLGVQLPLLMATLVAIAVIAISAVYIQREQSNAREQVRGQAQVILDTLATTLANAIYALDTDALATVMELLGAAETGVQARVYDPEGRTVADSTQEEGLTFDVDADPFGAELIVSNGLVSRWNLTNLEVGKAVIVGREPIGAVSIQVATAELEGLLRTALVQGLIFAGLATLIGAIASILVSRTITGPVEKIAGVAQRITGGDLSRRVAITEGNEIGQLGGAFNKMIDVVQKREKDLHEQAEKLRIATAKAKEAARVKGEFLANVSHELRTPLNAIIGFSDMLLAGMSGPLTDKQHHKVTRLRENGARLLALINDLLDLTRIEAGRVELVEKAFVPRTLSERMAAQMESLAVESKLKFETKTSPELPETLIGDEKRVEQVVVNLLSNAFKFTKEGAVTLSMDVDWAEQTWLLAVTDTGIGIPPHAVNVIFEEFRQLDASYSRAYRGSGLGLAITRNLVRMMGGKITVKSEMGKGTTFIVTLPIRVPEPSQLAALEAVGS